MERVRGLVEQDGLDLLLLSELRELQLGERVVVPVLSVVVVVVHGVGKDRKKEKNNERHGQDNGEPAGGGTGRDGADTRGGEGRGVGVQSFIIQHRRMVLAPSVLCCAVQGGVVRQRATMVPKTSDGPPCIS